MREVKISPSTGPRAASPVELKGLLAGKRIFVTSGKGGPSTVSDLRALLGRFPTRDTLRMFGEIAQQVEASAHDTICHVNGEPVPLYVLPYLALLAIEESDDIPIPCFGFRGYVCTDASLEPVWFVRNGGMMHAELARAIQMFHNLPSPMQEERDGSGTAAYEFMVRMGHQQFMYQGALNHLYPRTLLLYRDIWPTVRQAASLSPDEDLRTLTGLGLEEILWFAKAFYTKGRGGWFRPYESAKFDEIQGPLRKLLSVDGQQVFLEWISTDYETIRLKAAEHCPPTQDYDPYRFNPLIEYPIVRPDLQPEPQHIERGPVYLMPCARLLFLRVTRGLYHVLADYHAGEGKQNPFRTAFGHVFQEYVGQLLRASFGDYAVLPEWKYGSGDSIDTTDWIVVEDERAVLVEVNLNRTINPAS